MKFENNCIGNTNNNLLTFGTYAQRKNIVCESDDNTSIIINDEEKVISNDSSSYINIINNEVFFRNDSDRKIYCYSLKDSDVKCLVDANCGEMIVSKRGIYYIDYSTQLLNYYSFQTNTTEKVIDQKIKSFAVGGESLFVQTYNKNLELVNLDGSTIHIIGEVDRFFYDGTIYVQKGGVIYRISSLTSAERVFEEKKNARLIYVEDDYVFLLYNNKIQRVNIDGTDGTDIDEFENNEVFKYMYSTESGCEITYSQKNDSE